MSDAASPDPSRLLTSSRAFCMAPWAHLAVAIGGTAMPCCEAKGSFGDAKTQSLAEIWAGAPLQDLRARMIRDLPDERCAKCYDVERSGGRSMRHDLNTALASHVDRVRSWAKADGQVPPDAPISLDVRFSNLCNFSCRMCWHGSSSKWHADARKLGWTKAREAMITTFASVAQGIAALRPLLGGVERIYWAGGEPLLLEEHYAILRELLTLGRNEVVINYNSNLSELHLGRSDVLELWRQFRDVHVEVSIDGIDARGELIRHGLSWDRLLANIAALRSACPHVRIAFGVTVSVLNVAEIPALHRRLMAASGGPVDGMRFHVLQEPEFYSVRILPAAMKRRIGRMLMAYARTLNTHAPDTLARSCADQITHIVDHMRAQDWSHMIPKFRVVTSRLDRMRGEDTGAICRELAPLLREPLIDRVRRLAQTVLRRATRRRGKLAA